MPRSPDRRWLSVSSKPEMQLGQPGQAAPDGLRRLLATFEPITLEQMASSMLLLERSEIKYVLPRGLLLHVLADLRAAYRVLAVSEQPLSSYRTLYFDTASLALYHRHHAGAPNRYKVRAREYVNSQASYLEVKHRTGKRRTVKCRIPIADGTESLAAAENVTAITPQAIDFLAEACPYAADKLAASLWNQYTRITLVSRHRPERVTLDLDLMFARGAARSGLPGIVVAEVKHQGHRNASEFARLMHAYHVRETGFSKYCMGVSLLYPEVKHNRFKAKQRLLARLMEGSCDESP